MNEASTQYAVPVEPVPNYLERYAAEVELWQQESVRVRSRRAA